MSPQGSAVITGLGLVSSLGLCLEQSCSSVRAKINRYREDGIHLCNTGPPDWDDEPVIVASVPGMETGENRVIGLARAAAQDLLRTSRLKRGELASCGLYASLPPSADPEAPPPEPGELLAHVLGGGTATSGRARIFQVGHSGGFLAVQAALFAIREGREEMSIVLGADSYLDPEILHRLEEAGRLKCTANSSGFIPGEAGAAILLESLGHADARGAPVLSAVEAGGTAFEGNTVLSGETSVGEGLEAAIRAGLGGCDGEKIGWIASDLNGESYRATEWGYCQARLTSALEDELRIWHPADCLGDIGAATGPVLISLVSQAFRRGYSPSNRCLLLTSSDGGERSALIVGAG